MKLTLPDITDIRVLPNAITRPPHSIIIGFEEGPFEAATNACKTSPIPAAVSFGDVIRSPNRSCGRFLAGDEDGMAMLGDFEDMATRLLQKSKIASDSDIYNKGKGLPARICHTLSIHLNRY